MTPAEAKAELMKTGLTADEAEAGLVVVHWSRKFLLAGDDPETALRKGSEAYRAYQLGLLAKFETDDQFRRDFKTMMAGELWDAVHARP